MRIRIPYVLALALTLAAAWPARADGPATTKLTTPFACGSDELARAHGLMIAPAQAPRVASSQTAGCTAKAPPGVTVWSWYTAPAAGSLDVHVGAWSGVGEPCLYVATQTATISTACTLDPALTIQVAGGARYAIGVSLAEPSVAALLSQIDVTFTKF
jgi:hypothetical protein